MPLARAGLLPLAALLLSSTAALRADALPEGFTQSPVVAGLTGATAMEVAPDGRVFVCEQTGALRVVKDDKLLPEPFVSVRVDSSWERGLLGVAFDPRFAYNGFVYLCYISPTPYPHHRVSRFTARGDRAVPGSEVVLFEGDDQEKLGGGVKNGHQGGALHFGRDGKLYLAVGDQTAGAPAQDLNSLLGKILRLNPDGSIPTDNPFHGRTAGKYRAIWALGLRNPFTFAVQPGSGRMFINDVGGACEEVNEGAAGANYGWPVADHGPTSDRRFRGPVHWYRPESSIAGGAFYNPARPQFPARYAGKYFFGDFKAGWIKVLDPDSPREAEDFLTGLGNLSVVDIKVAADGGLLYLRRRAWVKDKDFKPGTGALYRVRWTGARTPPNVGAGPLPQTVPAGAAAHFRVAVTGSGPLKFQWSRDDKPVPGAAGPTYVLPSVTAADGGARFRCVVSNPFGRAASDPAVLRVTPSFDDLAARDFGGISVSPRPGAYTGPVTVRLSAPPGASLRCTTDGSAPNAGSPAYRGPLVLKQSATLRIQPFRGGRPVGKAVTAAYTVRGDRPYGLPWREPAAVRMPPTPEGAPRLLSQTGVFASLPDLRPAPGLVPYEVNAPLWSDGAAKRRWLVPGRGPVGFAAAGEWTFPAGTVFVKHFELPTDDTDARVRRRLETRLLVVDGTGNGYGVTYKWRPDHSDADLLADGLEETVRVRTASGARAQTWAYPSRADCLTCHTPAAGFVLGVKTRQLNRAITYPATSVTDNQLRTWNYLGLFDKALDEGRIGSFSKLVDVRDGRAGLEERARSYLDANCAGCHRPGTVIRAAFDARYETPLPKQGLLNAPTVSDSLGVDRPCVVAPGDPERSLLYLRLARDDRSRMPPLAIHVQDRAALEVLRCWIRELPARRR
jgi:uncharacterized repeat protein (TIGR03806 family)